jgi:TnpA family transposase
MNESRDPASRPSPRKPLASLTPEEVQNFFRPTSRYAPFLQEAHGPVHRVALFFHASYLESFKEPAPLGPIPDVIVRHIAQLLEDEVPVPLPYPDSPRTFFSHAKRVRLGLGWSDFDEKARRSFERWLAEEAHRTDDPRELRNVLEKRLSQAKVVRPAQSRIDRMVGHARKKALDIIAQSVEQALTKDQIQAIDGLRRRRAGTSHSHLQWLESPIGIPSPRALDEVLDRLAFVREFGLSHDFFERIHPNMRRRMMKTVEAYTVDRLWERFRDDRRHALVACYLHERLQALIDLAVEIFDGIALAMDRRSQADLAEDLRSRGPAINEKLLMFRTVGKIVVDLGIPDPAVRPAIFEEIPRERLVEALRELEELIRPPDYNIFDYLEARYPYLRSFFPRFLRDIELGGVPAAQPLLLAIQALKYWNAEQIRKLPADPPLGFVPEKWRRYVIPGDGQIDRHYYELCVMNELHRALQATEVWAVGGRRYGNVEDLLIPAVRWAEIRDECYQKLGLPKDARTWLAGVLPGLGDRIRETTEKLSQNIYALVEEDRVRLSPFLTEGLSERTLHLKDRVKASWPQVRIQDLLVEVDSWVGLSDFFQTPRGYRKTGENFERGLFASLIAKGCNIGTTRMASLTPEVSERSLRWIDESYLSQDTLQAVYERLLKAFRTLPISGWLGEEDVTMSDQWRLASRVGTIKSGLLPHEFAPGQRALTYYWHVTHQGPGFGAQVIGHDRDAAYVLDRLFDIQSELPIHEHFTDTHGATETTFALAYMFGIEFCPRIKLVHHQDLYFPPGFEVEGPFKKHFEGAINVELIETFWDDLVRILASVREGRTSVRLLTLRLSSYARQNPLYRVLREVGRIYKTRFIMRYYDDVDFRRRINAGLNRMELFNALARHLFYARRGENWERDLEQQLQRASALLILANACVLWNAVRLSEMASEFKRIGLQFTPEDFRHVSSYAFEHIVPYGQYFFTLRRKDQEDAFTRAKGL